MKYNYDKNNTNEYLEQAKLCTLVNINTQHGNFYTVRGNIMMNL